MKKYRVVNSRGRILTTKNSEKHAIRFANLANCDTSIINVMIETKNESK